MTENAPVTESIEDRIARMAEAARRLPNFGRARPQRVCQVKRPANEPSPKRSKVWHAKLAGGKMEGRSPVKDGGDESAEGRAVVGPDLAGVDSNAPRIVETGSASVGAWLSEEADCQNVRMLARLLRGFDLNDRTRAAVGGWVSNDELLGMGITRPNSRASQINVGSRVAGEVESNVAHDFVVERGLRIVAGNVQGLGWARRVEFKRAEENQRNLFAVQ